MRSRWGHLILYMVTFILTAIPLNCVGALIPYLAADLGIDQTQYSLIFVFSSVGAILATFIFKILEYFQKLPKHHIICLIMVYFGGAGCFVMAFMNTKISQCIMYLIFGVFCFFVIIVINICLVRAAPHGKIGMWVGFSHGAFGVGALIGPLLVPIFEIKLFIILAIAFAIVGPFFYFLPSPSDFEAEEQQNSQIKPLQKPNSREGSLNIQVIISFTFFILVGIEITIPAWAPTYAVKNGINDKQGAAKLSSIFWILSTVFRFVFGWLNIKQSLKLKILIAVQLISGLTCSILASFQYRQLAIYLCTALYGIGLSHVFPLLLSTPSEFGIAFNDSQISTMMISVTISSGTFGNITGVLMKDNVDMFFYSVVGFSLLLTVCVFFILKFMSEDQERFKEKGQQLKEQQL